MVLMLRGASFVAYLLSWLIVALGAGWSLLRRGVTGGVVVTIPAVVGTLLQGAGVWMTTFGLPDGPLRPSDVALGLALVLAPVGAGVFVWALRSAPVRDELATGGAYRWLRHPMYFAFLLLLVATGLLASAGYSRLIASVAAYVAGTEFRVANEESELAGKFQLEFPRYRARTRFLYLFGVR